MKRPFDSLAPAAILILALTIAPACPEPASAQTPQFITMWGSIGSGPGQFYTPVGIAFDSAHNVYVIDSNNNRVQAFTPSGAFLSQWGGSGSAQGQFQYALAIAIDANDHVFLADYGNSRVDEFTKDGDFVGFWGPAPGSQKVAFLDLATDGDVYLANGNLIQRYTHDGTLMNAWSVPGSDGIGASPDGGLYVCLPRAGMVRKYSSTGMLMTDWVTYGSAEYPPAPVRVAASAHGLVYVDDNDNCRILVYTSDGVYVTQWGSCGSGPGQFLNPIGIAVDANDNVYVADTNNSRIQKFGPVPTPTRVASWGSVKTRYR